MQARKSNLVSESMYITRWCSSHIRRNLVPGNLHSVTPGFTRASRDGSNGIVYLRLGRRASTRTRACDEYLMTSVLVAELLYQVVWCTSNRLSLSGLDGDPTWTNFNNFSSRWLMTTRVADGYSFTNSEPASLGLGLRRVGVGRGSSGRVSSGRGSGECW
jgi:hypothetical protein